MRRRMGPPTPLGVYGNLMDALQPMAGAMGGALGGLAGGPIGAALGSAGMMGTTTLAKAPIDGARNAEAGALGGPAMMALLMRGMGDKLDKPKAEAPASTRVTEPTHGMSAGHFNSYADQVKQEQAALDAGAPAPSYAPAPRTTPITQAPPPAAAASPAAQLPGPRMIAGQMRKRHETQRY